MNGLCNQMLFYFGKNIPASKEVGFILSPFPFGFRYRK